MRVFRFFNVVLVLVDLSVAAAAAAATSVRSSLAEQKVKEDRNDKSKVAQVAKVPMPTRAQQRYADHEIMVLITFNMGTYFPRGFQDPACKANNWEGPTGSGNPANFHPYLLDTDQWGQIFQQLGAKHAVLTAKHGCGFLLWPTQVPLRNAATNHTQEYAYAVGRPGASTQVDVLDKFATSMRKYGLGAGFYYSMKNNFYLNMQDHHFVNKTHLLPGQVNVTHVDYEAMALDHLAELWTNYGELTEIWFDGGYTNSTLNRLTKMLEELQPSAVVWRGQGITKSTVAWVGTESGFPVAPDEIWSTGCDIVGENGATGHPDSPVWCPKGCDTTLQENDEWFYIPEVPIRSLSTMMEIYHQTVGRNGVLELDVAVDGTGRVHYDHAQRYKQMGDYIETCYGSPLQNWTNVTGYVIDLELEQPVLTDRIMLREDQWRGGQRVRDYKIYIKKSQADEWSLFSQGKSIGNKRIDMFNHTASSSQKTVMPAPVQVHSVRFHAVEARDTPMLRDISIFAPCPDPTNFTMPATTTSSTEAS